jgi:NAD-dependent DNA ligase
MMILLSKNPASMEHVIENIKKDPLPVLKTLTPQQIVQILEVSDTAFFGSNKPLFTDDMYDIVKGYLKSKDPKNPYLKRVGAVIEFNKEKLPYYLGSLYKIKDDEKEIMKWRKNYTGDYVISEKLDGISCLLTWEKGSIKMYSRGNGVQGQNITHILPYIQLDTSTLTAGSVDKIAIRGELIISRNAWKSIQDVGSNARNVVAGAIHSKTVNKNIVKYIEFIAYDLIFPRRKLSDGLHVIAGLGLPVVRHIKMSSDDLSIQALSQILQEWRASSAYEIDGIVVYSDEVHKIVAGKNPKYAFAFKSILTQEEAEVIVTDVLWNVSKHRYLKPTVTFNEVSLAGVKIRQATGFNAAYISKHNIGPGSRLMIIRSGDVIPHINKVITPSSTGLPKMPATAYTWNDTNIDIILQEGAKNREHDIATIVHFMNTLEIPGVKQGVVTKLYDAGHDSLQKIIKIGIDDLMNIEGFKEKSASKVHEALLNIRDADCLKLMVASNAFGRNLGIKKLQLIVNVYPDIKTNRNLLLVVQDLIKIDGIAEISAKQFIESLPIFYAFIDDIGLNCNETRLQTPPKQNDKFVKVFKDKTVVFTGFRNKDWEQFITDAGGRVATGISGVTDILIVKDTENMSIKIQKAIEKGVKIMTKQDVEKMVD